MLLELLVLVLPEVTYAILVRLIVPVEHRRLDKLAWRGGSRVGLRRHLSQI